MFDETKAALRRFVEAWHGYRASVALNRAISHLGRSEADIALIRAIAHWCDRSEAT